MTVSSHLPEKEWQEVRKQSSEQLFLIAHHFHNHMIEQFHPNEKLQPLSPREVECIKWASEGKTAWETSQILNIKETTVLYFIDKAREKLKTANKVQAVAKAVRLNLI